jgi:chromosomal replication initiation ATPase DnaA
MSQLPLSLPLAPVFAEDNFCVSACNEEAHRWIMQWPNWNSHALIIHGASGSGKTHLGHMWAAKARADINPESASTLRGNALLENIEIMDAQTLFHMLNIAKEHTFSLLLTCTVRPTQLPHSLPDLTSRLLALPCIAILPPDDEVISAALRKQFSDRQLKVDDEVIAYIIPRMERSFAKARELVEQIDRASLAEGRHITVPFVKQLL